MLGKFVIEHLTSLTLDVQTEVFLVEGIDEIWETLKKETMEKVRGNKNRSARAESPMTDEEEILFAR